MFDGTVIEWDEASASGVIEKDGMQPRSTYVFHDSREFYVNERVTFDLNGNEAMNIQEMQ